MKFKKNILSISTSVAMLSMVGCGVTSQDDGQGGGSAVSGVAVDGYIAGGVVYIDTNENFEIDQWEPRAFTDERGYFTYAPAIVNGAGEEIKPAVFYCDLPKTDARSQFCLKIPAAESEVLVRITKGYDLSTAEPFIGTMTMKVSSNVADLSQYNVVSPITGLLAKMGDTEKAAFLIAEGVPDLESVDFLDFSAGNALAGDDEQRLRILSLALMVHNISNVAGQQIAADLYQSVNTNNANKSVIDSYSENQVAADAISENSFMLIASDNVLNALLALIRGDDDSNTMSTLLVNSGDFASKVLGDMKEKLEERTGLRINEINPNYVAPDMTSVVGDMTKMRSVLVWPEANAENGSFAGNLEDFVKGKLRVTEIVSSLINNKASTVAVAKAIDLSKDPTFIANLANDKVDISHLKKRIVEEPGSVVAADADYSSRQCFTEMLTAENAAANGLSLTEGGAANTEGLAFNTLNMSETNPDGSVKNGVVVDFFGETTAVESGDMKITATFSEGDFAKKDADGVSVGQVFSGTWNQLDACTMLLKVDVAGVIETVIVKPTLTKDDVSAYNFDLGGKQRVWVPKISS